MSNLNTMAEAGSFAERVKQQADIVRVIGEYVRLKKTGAEFHRPLPVPSGKDSFVRRASGASQIYHCFGAARAATFSNS